MGEDFAARLTGNECCARTIMVPIIFGGTYKKTNTLTKDSASGKEKENWK